MHTIQDSLLEVWHMHQISGFYIWLWIDGPEDISDGELRGMTEGAGHDH